MIALPCLLVGVSELHAELDPEPKERRERPERNAAPRNRAAVILRACRKGQKTLVLASNRSESLAARAKARR